MRFESSARALLLVACAALVGWVRLLPLGLDGLTPQAESEARDAVEARIAATLPAGVPAASQPAVADRVQQWIVKHPADFAAEVQARLQPLQAERRYVGGDARQWVYLGDIDSYLWLRHARNFLARGTTCGAIVDGHCRDTLAHAPVGRDDRYAGSPHALAIAGIHRLITLFDPGYPLPASSFLVPVIVSVLGVLPAFALGGRLAGALGAVAAALLIGLNPFFLVRTAGSDNDVWNVVLPLFMMWAAVAALEATSSSRRVALAVLAGAVAGLHAATWRGWFFTWAVLLAGLGAIVAVQALRWARGQAAARVALLAAVLVAGVYYVAAGAGVTLARPDEAYWTLPLQRIADVGGQGGATAPPSLYGPRWPNVLESVSELKRPDRHGVSLALNVPLLLPAAWVGLVLLALPRRRWRWWHFVVFAGALGLDLLLLDAALRPLALVLLLAAPLAAAVLLSLLEHGDAAPDRRRPPYPVAGAGEHEIRPDSGAGLIVICWLLAALFAAYGGARFVLLLVAPLGLAAGAGLGRLQQFAATFAAARLVARPRAEPWIRLAIFAGFASLLVLPVQRGTAAARSFLPLMNDAWWDTFAGLAATAPPDAVIHAWWDRGYWAAYGAERGTSADGGSLLTHLPYWFGKALLAGDEGESAGLLRMLGCGSDAPEADGERGAYGKLVRYGVDPAAAPALIADLAGRDRDDATRLLNERGLDQKQRDDVLISTHCAAPPAYLVLSSRFIENATWRRIGGWDFGRALAADTARARPRAEAERTLQQRLGLDAEAARALIEESRGLVEEEAVANFISPPSVYLTPDWLPCVWREESRELDCRLPSNARGLARFVYRADAPGDSELLTRRGSGHESAGTPAAVVVADGTGIETYEFQGATHPGIAALVDVQERRVLLGSPDLIRSTFTQLLFLDGRTTPHFEKVGEQRSLDGERVSTWRVH